MTGPRAAGSSATGAWSGPRVARPAVGVERRSRSSDDALASCDAVIGGGRLYASVVDVRPSAVAIVGAVFVLTLIAIPATGRAMSGGAAALPPRDCPWASVGLGATTEIQFTESGLPSGTSWGLALLTNGSYVSDHPGNFSEPSGNLSVISGRYLLEVANVTGGTALYVPTPRVGCLVIAGSTMAIRISYARMDRYVLSFGETGLPSGFGWGVSFHGGPGVRWAIGSNRSTISALVPNGTYSYSIQNVTNTEQYYVPTPADGSVTVAGANATVSTEYTSVATTLFVLTETGLPTGAYWCAGITLGDGSTSWCVPTATISFELPAGTVPYVVQNATVGSALYVPDPSGGTVTANGTEILIRVTFAQVPTFAVTFLGSGIPNGTVWNVIVSGPALGGGVTGRLVGTNVTVDLLPAGSYTYTIQPPAGYGADPATGSFVLGVSDIDLPIAFSPMA